MRMKAKTRPVCFARSGDDDAVRTRNIWDLLSTRMGCGARESSRVEAGYRRVAFAEGGSLPRSAGDPVDERTNERTLLLLPGRWISRTRKMMEKKTYTLID
jgi:hypothetical protein